MTHAPEPSDLHRLIEAPRQRPGRHWARLASRVIDRLLRGPAGRQRRIDHALAGGLTELRGSAERLRADLAELERRTNETHEWLRQTSGRGEAIGGRLEAFCADQERANVVLSGEIARLERLVADDHLLAGDGDPGLEEFDGPVGGRVVGYRSGRADSGDGVYLGFEDVFRGSEDEIRDRQRAYLPLLRGNGPVLDVGCGRANCSSCFATRESPPPALTSTPRWCSAAGTSALRYSSTTG